MRRSLVVCVLAGAIFSTGAAAQDGLSPADRALARDIFKQLIEINTTDSLGNTPRAARAMAQRLLAAGFPAPDVRVLIGPDATHGNLVARYRRRVMCPAQAREKVCATSARAAVDKGGHSSLPRPADNPIYRLARVLQRLADYQFPVQLNEVSRAFFERSAAIETGQLADDMRGVLKDPPDSGPVARLSAVPFYNSKLRTTCVATMLAAGHAENALPQAARATVNCRILPGEPAAAVEATLTRLAGRDRITVSTVYTPVPSPPSPLTPTIMSPLERLVADQFPGVPIVPVMEAGATDGLFLRNAGIPTYGVSAVFEDPNDIRAHGRDERIGVQSFYDALEFWHHMLRAFAS